MIDKNDEDYHLLETVILDAKLSKNYWLANLISRVLTHGVVPADCLPALAELESLRAMRKRVEGKVQGWETNGTEDARFCASQIREALGDSHE